MKTPSSIARAIAVFTVVALPLLALPDLANAVEYAVRNKGSTKVQVIEQRLMPQTSGGTKGGPGHVLAKYSDLIQKAIAYKTAHPGEAVEIRFATYKMSRDIYVGFNPAHTASYMKISDTDFAGANSEHLLASFCKAAQAGVNVKMIMHKEGDVAMSTITAYLDANGGPNLSYRVVGWGDASDDQMHNKFMFVNKMRSGTTDNANVVYTATANVDEWQAYGPVSSHNWAQNAVLLYENAGLYEAYRKYFDNALWPHATNTSPAAFRSTMASLHAAPGGLNYAEDADGISAYFYPYFAPNVWSIAGNPVTKVMNLINNGGATAPFIKTNQAYFRFHNSNWPEFGAFFMADIYQMAGIHGLDLSSATTPNVKFVLMDDDDDGNDFSPLASQHVRLGKPTHSKTFSFQLSLSGTPHYYSMTGSTNAKHNDHMLKANNTVVIHEIGAPAKEVYQDFDSIFSYVSGL